MCTKYEAFNCVKFHLKESKCAWLLSKKNIKQYDIVGTRGGRAAFFPL